MRLSVIIIGRNEASHIRKCIESVLKGTESIPNVEIVYVDSASTDETIPIAKQYPITIVQLKPQWPLSASAGRYIGTQLTKGDFIFFIDGDTLLYRKWMKEAIAFLESNQDVAGIAGVVHELFEDQRGKVVGHLWNRYAQKFEEEQVSTFGGIALFRRSILEKTGTFNPYLTVDEERELAYRIQQAGYKLIRIKKPMAITYGPPRESMKEILRRSKSQLYKYGITLKYCLAQGFFWKYFLERLIFVILFLLSFCALIFVTIILLASGHARLIPVLFFAGILGMVLLKKGNIKSAMLSFVKRFVYTFQTLITFFRTKVKPVGLYPEDVLWIKRQ